MTATLAIALSGAALLSAAWHVRRRITRRLLRMTLRLVYRVEVDGLAHAEQALPRAVIAANHASFLDGLLLGAFLPGRPVFAVDTRIATRWWARPFLSLVDARPVDPANPHSIRAMIRAVAEGRSCIIFPEGRLTTTGGLMKVYEGPALIAERASAPLVPVRIEGVEDTPFSRLAGKTPRRWFPRIRIRVLPPQAIAAPAGVRGRARRAALRDRLADVMIEATFASARIDTTILATVLDAARRHGAGFPIASDATGVTLTYRRLLAGAFALGRRLAAVTAPGDCVGVLLPTSAASLVTFVALHSTRRVPAMLNATSGASGLESACLAAGLRVVVTARAFVERAGLHGLVAALETRVTVLYLEDLKASIGPVARMAGLLGAITARPRHDAARANDPAVVLFTSGSEGTPKGVVLTHRNLLANRAQLASVLDLSREDLVFNALPLFHSFGLTGGLLLPLLSGVPTFLYPSPLHYRAVPELAYGLNATILFGTDTFLRGYAKAADAYDFYNVRYVFAGAERVAAETRRLWFDKFGLRILEGYGATETAPALAVNTPRHFKAGTVGRFLPGIAWRLAPIAGVTDGARLAVAGPNVMAGYLRAERPGMIEPPEGGWYDTGDVVHVDDDGFVTIRGRAKRFAKIAGEMVSLGAVEDLAAATWPGFDHAVVAVADARRGEQLVLVTTAPTATRQTLMAAARAAGRAEITVPRTVLGVRALPVLGTGKTDYQAVGRLAAEMARAS
jgi:acyl-[acyl-carrier-protein]-phospholipid O-acyltransferase/long-chain-fatty-acid--[acyl-carrier-protein] ligase